LVIIAMKARRPDSLSRRRFLRWSAGTTVAGLGCCITPLGVFRAGAQPVPSERIVLGLIGVGLMGRGHLSWALGNPNVELAAVCDVDQTRLRAAQEAVAQSRAAAKAGEARPACLATADFREVLARPDINAVVVVTPDHWHTPISVEALKAGKDVYCEKPVSMTVQEGRALIQTVQRHGRVFQTGTQYRSIPTIRQICDFVRAGGLGKVKAAFTILNNLSSFMGAERFKPHLRFLDMERNGSSYIPLSFNLPAEAVPDGLDWPMWVGPAPWREYHSLYHINPSPGVVPWSFATEFGLSSNTWHLSHSADVLQYALGVEESGPCEIIHPSSGRYPTLTCRYRSGTLLHFVDHWGMVKEAYGALSASARLAGLFGGVIVGERGWITTMSSGGRIEGEPESLFEELKLPTREVAIGSNNHHANWLECIRARTKPSCHEVIGHRSACLGHLAYIASELGRSLTWDTEREQFEGDAQANRLLSRAMREPWRL
jgi:hypothetical protein